MLRDGSFLIANRGDGREGGVWRLHRNGQVEPFLLEVDGITLPRTNFVLLDDQDRVWVSISTVHKPDYEFSPTRADGFIALVDKRGARIAGGGIVWTNECRINPSGTHMYVNETWAQRVSRFRLAPDGSLSNKEIVAELGPGNYSDGLTFDVEGGAWITCVVSNRLIRVTEDGRMQTIVEDYEPDHMARAIAANAQGQAHPHAGAREPSPHARQHLESRVRRTGPAHRAHGLDPQPASRHVPLAGCRRAAGALEISERPP